jgi:DNA repair protein RadC
MVASIASATEMGHHSRQHGSFFNEDLRRSSLSEAQPFVAGVSRSEGSVASSQPSRSTSLGSASSRAGRSASTDAERDARVDESWMRLCSSLLSVEAEAIPDEDLLAFLLSYIEKSEDVRPVASNLISKFETLAGVLSACPDRIAGATPDPRIIALFHAVRAIASRLAKEEICNRPVVSSWQKLIDYLRTMMAHQRVEQFRVMFLDRLNVLIADEILHEGTIDHTPVYPREVLKRALELDASAIIMVHNHPSNHPAPSRADIQMTRELKLALESVGLVLHDHLIVSRKGHTSFKQMQLI